MPVLTRMYRRFGDDSIFEECFYFDNRRSLKKFELDLLRWVVSGSRYRVSLRPFFKDRDVVEIGPRLPVETPFSSSAVAICSSIGIPVRRVEKSIRYRSGDRDKIVDAHLDQMTQVVYEKSILTFKSHTAPEPVKTVDILGLGSKALQEANMSLGLGMDEWDIGYYTKLFNRLGRNPTDVELFQIGNANSEHSRHWFFLGDQIIDGKRMPKTLMEIVKETVIGHSSSIVAFKDNSGVIKGPSVPVFVSENPGFPSAFGVIHSIQHITATAETHNHPTLVAPFPGAETGSGGRIRDSRAVGRGGLVHAGLAGYCVGNLHLKGYPIHGENVGGEKSNRHASPLEILIQGSNGVSDYGNKIGEPLIGGFCRSFGLMVNDFRREFRKPVLYCGGMGRVLDQHVKKRSPRKGMLIVRIGGPAYRIGVGGGSASSMIHGEQGEQLDFQSVQRGNAEMENRVNRVIQACAELLEDNPIESLHDQGAGGPSNVITELMEPTGGKVDIRKITLGDETMSVLEIWVAEYQEGYGLLVKPKKLDILKSICNRERVNCEVLGDITGDGRVTVCDSDDGSTPVDLSLGDILSKMPRKKFESEHLKIVQKPLKISQGLTIEDAVRMVFKLPQVGSKGFLVHKVDRSVTGLVARQQCCGPTQVPVADVAVTADGYFGLTGAATALGEQPIKMLVSPGAGARMAVAEMLTNLCSVKITKLSDVTCRANWMWAAKRPGEGALLYDAAVAMRDILLLLNVAIDGGKDSLSMATHVGEELVVSPGELVIMGYAPVPDITKVVTPDLKGSGCIGFINFGRAHKRLGGSALAQALGQIGDQTPDLDSDGVLYLKRGFEAVQELIDKNHITAYHDVSDGGVITALAEMCIAGNRGVCLKYSHGTDCFSTLFCEEAGMLFEYAPESSSAIDRIMKKHEISYQKIGDGTDRDKGKLSIVVGKEKVFDQKITELRKWWESTSTELELQQADQAVVKAEAKTHAENRVLTYKLSFEPKKKKPSKKNLPRVAIIREEGTNGDREMAAAFLTVGFEPWDITMSDILQKRVSSLDDFRGLVFPGGFSYADVFGSAKGWAVPVIFDPHLKEIFDRFYDREDTFSLGVCNGCQLMANIGWLPYKGISKSSQPQLIHNKSGRFESRWVGVRVRPSPSIMLDGMEGSILGINVAHGEGQFFFPDREVVNLVRKKNLVCLEYVDPIGQPTESYPYNPNGSRWGWTALCTPDGRHLAMMPHPERSFLKWQWPWMPEEFRNLDVSPWLKMFQNAYGWCKSH